MIGRILFGRGVSCSGTQTIIVADNDLDEAERRTSQRDTGLRTHDQPQTPACVRVVIDPTGRSVTPDFARQLAGTH